MTDLGSRHQDAPSGMWVDGGSTPRAVPRTLGAETPVRTDALREKNAVLQRKSEFRPSTDRVGSGEGANYHADPGTCDFAHC
jgi:hypothetical protein